MIQAIRKLSLCAATLGMWVAACAYDGPDGNTAISQPDYGRLTSDNHPRLLMDAAGFESLKARISSGKEPVLARLHESIMTLADKAGMKDYPLDEYILDASNTRLEYAGEACLTIFPPAYAYKMTGDRKYLDQVTENIRKICSLKDWNARHHYLDAAEIAIGIAFAYDWLYHDLDEETRETAKTALKEKAMQNALDEDLRNNFYKMTNNWNQVCNGSMIVTSLALFESYPEEARTLIEKGLESNVAPMKAMYSPDGTYPEGYSYWCYGTFYEAIMLSALEFATGTDGGLSGIPGFRETGEYMLFMEGLERKCFNYSDCAENATKVLAMWYFAEKFDAPELLANELKYLAGPDYQNAQYNRLIPVTIAWASRIGNIGGSYPDRKLWTGDGDNPLVMIRTGWQDSEDDKYLAIKAGKAGNSHGHMDAGSFVYDAYGFRWAMDLGLQPYASVEQPLKDAGGSLWDMSPNSLRWGLVRMNNRYHNTLTINGTNHAVNGEAVFTGIIDNDREKGGIIDMTQVLAGEVESATRTIRLVDEAYVVVTDEITATDTKDAAVEWNMATRAVPATWEDRIELSGGDTGTVMILRTESSGPGVSYFSREAAKVHSYDAENPGVSIVGFKATVPAGQTARFETVLERKPD